MPKLLILNKIKKLAKNCYKNRRNLKDLLRNIEEFPIELGGLFKFMLMLKKLLKFVNNFKLLYNIYAIFLWKKCFCLLNCCYICKKIEQIIKDLCESFIFQINILCYNKRIIWK